MGKKERTRELIINTAIGLFIKKRSENVSMDEIAESAGIARRTLFNHFNTKEQLILEITSPIFNYGIYYLEELNKRDQITLDAIADLCFSLWKEYEKNTELFYSIDFEDFSQLKELHSRYIKLYIDIFQRIEDLPIDLIDKKRELASIVFRCFVPILSNISAMNNPEKRFREALKGLVYGLSI
ncbi:MAG: TetR/AcrR family transcriptional regulator [Spirochaetales bacterium]|nr:TetR/AcrR family transcriptional regulator [Spirochaetales bacterium]